MFVLMLSESGSNVGHVDPKPRSLGQIPFKPFINLRDQKFASFFLLLHQNACPDHISVMFEYGLCG